MSKRLTVCIDASLKIRDVGKSGTRGFVFDVTDEEFEKSKEIKAFLKVGWLSLEETTQEIKPKTTDEKIVDNNVKLRRDEKEDIINKLKDLKNFKSNFPGIIDEKWKMTEQIEKYDRLLEDKVIDKLNDLKKYKEKFPGKIDETLTPLEQIKVFEYEQQEKKKDEETFASKMRPISMNEDTEIGKKLKKPSIKKAVEKLRETKETKKEEIEPKPEVEVRVTSTEPKQYTEEVKKEELKEEVEDVIVEENKEVNDDEKKDVKSDDDLINSIFDEEEEKSDFKGNWKKFKSSQKINLIKTGNLSVDDLKWVMENERTKKILNLAKEAIEN